MPAPELVRRFVLPLEGLGFPYMVTGSVAAMAYGEPRLTNDVDVVIELKPQDATRFCTAFEAPDLYVPPLETVRDAAVGGRGEWQFNLILPAMALKADFYVAREELDRWALERRRREPVGEGAVWLAPPEYVIVRKLEFYRTGGHPKHLLDVRSMLDRRSSVLDLAELERLVTARGVEAELATARAAK